MNLTLSPEIREIMDVVHYRPALSIIQPLEAQISLKTEMAHTLKIVADKAERELRQYYPDDQCELIMQKLQTLIANLDIPVKKKGIAIYVSPIFEKVFYLDCPVTEKLIVDESFEIRDLLYSAKQDIEFLLLILSGKEVRLFLGDLTTLNVLPLHIPESIYAYVTDSPERVANFSDITEHKQITIDKFLRHIDDELGKVIKEHKLPVLITGTQGILGEFKKITRNTASVMDYLEGNYESSTIAELTELISPYLDYWKIRVQMELLGRLEEAAGQHLLAKGIMEVWQAAHEGKGKLLVVEKNYRFAAQRGAEPGMIEALTEPYNHFSYIRDVVDDVLEKVLESGGNVEFIEDDVLIGFDHIALIKYYE
jgi:hypothetical protein